MLAGLLAAFFYGLYLSLSLASLSRESLKKQRFGVKRRRQNGDGSFARIHVVFPVRLTKPSKGTDDIVCGNRAARVSHL